MNQINIQYHKTKIGELILGSYENKLCMLNFKNSKTRDRINNRLQKELKAKFIEQSDQLLQETKNQIDQFLNSKREKFNIPTISIGTEFQKKVWKALSEIPYGQTISYLDLAKKINNPSAVRAVANANGANTLALIIPCHRVISNNGSIGGYGGGLEAKRLLLDLETD